MRRKKIFFMTLVMSVLLIFSTFGITAVDMTTSGLVGSIDVTKEVWDDEWTDSITAGLGDTVKFRITVTYYNATADEHWALNITVTDTLPDCLDYLNTEQPCEPDVSGKILTWDFGSTPLYHEESIVIIFNATVIDCTDEDGEDNEVEVTSDEYCTGGHLSDEDSATVIVLSPEPGIEVEKKVWDPEANDGAGGWAEEAYAMSGEEVRFKITVNNTGECPLDDVVVNDTLPDGLEYANDASPNEPDNIVDNYLIWEFTDLEPDDEIIIEFNATVIDTIPGNEHENEVVVTGFNESCCPGEALDKDDATVKVSGMLVEKEVRTGNGPWVEEVDASVGETVRFRIIIYYYGDYTLYDIHVEDELPDCLEYADNADPEETEIDGQTIIWDLEGALSDEGSVKIEFDADVVGYDPCSECECENIANVTATECSGDVLEEADNATVDIKCAFIADAGGPYYGEIDEDIEITGSATGGTPPYLFEWDLDDDGIYGELEDETGEVTKFSWDEEGNYEIHLRVIDDEDNTAYDTAAVIISPAENNPPNKPSKPSGPTGGKAGKEYTYYSTATDPDGDQIYYKFDWGDGSHTDTELYDSGAEGNASHVWGKGSWEIKVKAVDEHGAGSEWSDPLVVSMPKNKQLINLEPGIYVDNVEKISFPITIVVGSINIEVDAEGANKVEFYLDDDKQPRHTDYEEPYEWLWDEFSFGRHMLKVVTYDETGNSATDEMKVWKFF